MTTMRIVKALMPIDRAWGRIMDPLAGWGEALFGCSSKTLALRALDIGLLAFVVLHAFAAVAAGESLAIPGVYSFFYAVIWLRDRREVATYSPPNEVEGALDLSFFLHRSWSGVVLLIIVAGVAGRVMRGVDLYATVSSPGTLLFWATNCFSLHAVSRNNGAGKSVLRRLAENLGARPAVVPVRSR